MLQIYSPSGSEVQELFTGRSGITAGCAFDPSSGDLLVAEYSWGLVSRFDFDGMHWNTLVTWRRRLPVDLHVSSSGQVYLGDAADGIVRVVPGTVYVLERYLKSAVNSFDISFDGYYMFYALDDARIMQLNMVTGERTVFSRASEMGCSFRTDGKLTRYHCRGIKQGFWYQGDLRRRPRR
jgi:hypothetical protein